MNKLNIEQHHEALAAQLPMGRIWQNKTVSGSNLFGLLRGLAPTFLRMDAAVQDFIAEALPFTTSAYLSEWEEALGIPDECIPLADSDDLRRRNITLKLRIMAGVQTRADFQAIAAVYGFADYQFHSGIEHVATVEGGYGLYTPVVTLASLPQATLQAARNTLVVVEGDQSSITFPWEFPLEFSATGQNQLRCIIRKLVPAHVGVVFVEEV